MDGLFDESIEKNLNSHYIKGVTCSVKNCVYHDDTGCCTASSIAVGPGYASSCTDTACATFRAKQ
ncbi:MAG: DUF1540 domain-containing protein [Clostridia bacterium]|nr:DUF1540 domain-containing protein [Clostridia bacterium]MBP5244998.1 DUF1540 domain-containing protein [Clostridia bacterium]MBR4979105.1 DUF1540 domain-containing protein [Clostridia bacterium]MCR5353234.1 DUF1540 domain-containing protein [Clostridiales bacterium]